MSLYSYKCVMVCQRNYLIPRAKEDRRVYFNCSICLTDCMLVVDEERMRINIQRTRQHAFVLISEVSVGRRQTDIV